MSRIGGWLASVRAGRRGRGWLAAAVAVAVVGSSLGAPPTLAVAAVAVAAPGLEPDRSVPVWDAATRVPPWSEMPSFVGGGPVVWPAAGSAELSLPVSGRGRGPASAVVGGLAVRVEPAAGGDVLSGAASAKLEDAPGRVRLSVLDRSAAQRAGVAVALRLDRVDGGSGGRVRVALDYSGFAGAFGAGWGSRLRLVRLPACALTTPQAEGCGDAVPLDSVNEAGARVVSADVDLAGGLTLSAPAAGVDSLPGGGVVLALVASSSSQAGDFSKTDLKPSSSWAAGGHSGDFAWSYPLAVPPVPGGLAPSVVLSYSSAAVDGQTAGGNTQPSVFGEGWSYSPGYIERSYRPCADDADNSPHWTQLNATGDLCWRLPNARIVLNGKSTEIVLGDDGVWRLADDDGEKVQLLLGAPNGDNDGEHWKITTTDGTQYWFGKQVLPNGRGNTNGTPVVPVFANHSGEPCFSTTSVSASRCQQAWRWMLDYVVDRYGNEISYWYTRDTVRTGLMGSATSTAAYHRSVYLYRIEYGTRVGWPASKEPPARVVVINSPRCVTSSCGTKDEANWPDTPWDLECLAASCPNNLTPSFWSSTRVSSIYTAVAINGTNRDVDEWTIGHQFPGDVWSPVLWLSSITRTGYNGGAPLTLPSLVTFGTKMQNRADYDPNASMASHEKYRITSLRTEHGSQVDVTYSADDTGCVFGPPFPDPDNNPRRCFPQLYTNPSGSTGWAWWHKRVVTRVVESDLTGGSPPITYDYTYTTASSSTSFLWSYQNGAAVWQAPLAKRSWSHWRGYSNVSVITGPPGGLRSRTDYLYFRGMDGDRTDSGHRSVQITEFNGGSWWDYEHRAGDVLNTFV